MSTLNTTTANITALNIGGAAISDVPLATSGRLTLTTAVPVTTADVTAASTIYFTPYKGAQISIYDGTSKWVMFDYSEINIALSGGTASKPHDIFIYDNGGTLTLELLAWTDDDTRATAIVLQDGIYVKSGDTTRRCLGTAYLDGSKQCEDSLETRHVWNMNNRVNRALFREDPNSSWAYTVATYRQVRASTANRFSLMVGLNEDAVYANHQNGAHNATGGAAVQLAIGLDSTTTIADDCTMTYQNVNAGNYGPVGAQFSGLVGEGKHELVMLEKSGASGTTTWLGLNAGTITPGMSGHFLC